MFLREPFDFVKTFWPNILANIKESVKDSLRGRMFVSQTESYAMATRYVLRKIFLR